jgi:hypothetical protein
MSTVIKKHPKIATLTNTTGNSYSETVNPNFDSITINDMIHDIESLDEDSHEQIYLLLRGFKPASFFTTDRGGGGTHFDRSQLSERQSQELYRTVQLCKENMKRKQVLDNAKVEHEYRMSLLSV